MSSKKWFFMFILTAVLICALYAGASAAVDPFGAFGDRFLKWYSYDMTNNPRVAKISYLEQSHGEYDSYIVGSSSTSSYPVEELNRYYGASFYNMIMYGADMLDVEQVCEYLIENYTVKNLIVNLFMTNGAFYDVGGGSLTQGMHALADGSSLLEFYARYAFIPPQYTAAKLRALREDSYLPEVFDVFNEKTGSYDKTRRDIEPIGGMDGYMQAYPVFANYSPLTYELNQIENCADSLARIKELCEDRGINFTVFFAPMYAEQFYSFDESEVRQFFTRVAEVTPFWDFSVSSLSLDPRYFYDESHFRNAAGTMALARVFGNSDGVYVPEDFGYYVTAENAASRLDEIYDSRPAETVHSSKVPVIIYHHLSKDPEDGMDISPERFEEQIKALSDAGYAAVSFDELIAYVERGESLPEKPVCITFDDGYLSNYELAFPILEKYGMKATIFIIGCTVGETGYYKDTGYLITPHFSFDQAREMIESGLISIQSHTYDMHQSSEYEGPGARVSILRFESEAEDEYIDLLRSDCEVMSGLFISEFGYLPSVLAYPRGEADELSAAILKEMGYKATLSTREGVAELVQGLPQSLLCLPRICPYEITDGETLLNMISG